VIDIDAIPLDLPVKPLLVASLYVATFTTLPDGREVIMPHYSGPVWQWFGKQLPTLAHGRRGHKRAEEEPTRESGLVKKRV
jgi:hypothetical protein